MGEVRDVNREAEANFQFTKDTVLWKPISFFKFLIILFDSLIRKVVIFGKIQLKVDNINHNWHRDNLLLMI